MGGDDEEGLIAQVTRWVELAFEVDGLADAEAERRAAPQENVRVGGGPPGSAAISEDGQGDNPDAVAVEDAIVVGEQATGQIGVVPHLDLDVDEKPLVGAVEQAHLDQLVGTPVTDLGVGIDLTELLLERNGFDRPIDEACDVGKGELEEGAEKQVESAFPRAVVIERIHAVA